MPSPTVDVHVLATNQALDEVFRELQHLSVGDDVAVDDLHSEAQHTLKALAAHHSICCSPSCIGGPSRCRIGSTMQRGHALTASFRDGRRLNWRSAFVVATGTLASSAPARAKLVPESVRSSALPDACRPETRWDPSYLRTPPHRRCRASTSCRFSSQLQRRHGVDTCSSRGW